MTEYRIRWLPNWIPWKRAFVFWLPFTDHPWVCIPANRKTDPLRLERTRAHEIVHVEQWLRLGRWGFLKRYFGSDKMELEAEAFAGSCTWWYQAGHTHVDTGGTLVPVLAHYAGQLWTYYKHDASEKDCKDAIERYLA